MLIVVGQDPNLTVAQYAALTKQIPLLYFVLLVNAWCLSATHFTVAPRFLVLDVPVAMTVLCGIRMMQWIRRRHHVPAPEAAARGLRLTHRLAIALGVVFMAWGFAFLPYGDIVRHGHVFFFVTFTAVSCMTCLMHLRATVLSLAMIFSVPSVITLSMTGDAVYTAMSVNITLVLAAMVFVASIYYGDFAKLIGVQRALIGKQGELETLSAENMRLANVDSLTGLPNRRSFFDALHARIDLARREGGSVTLGILDLDGFKAVNDTRGHGIGDALLVDVGQRLAEASQESFVVYRLGGDEFALLGEADLPADAVLEKSSRLCAALAVPFAFGHFSAHISATIGLAAFPAAADSAPALFERADYALYHAKRNAARGQPVLFNREHEAAIRKESEIEQALQAADLDAEFEVVFQPIMETRTETLVGFEALARWNSPKLGAVSPNAFVIVAERVGLISAVTPMLLRKALAVARTWPENVRLSFNLSAEDVNAPKTMLGLVAMIHGSGFDPRRLDVEITETAMLRDIPQVLESIAMLKAMGIAISLDDFGTGYSSLNHVHRLPLDRIKIDRSFVRGIDENPTSSKIVKSVLALCRDIGIACVVEGVETKAELQVVTSLGAEMVQGFLYARPISSAETADFIAANAAGQGRASIVAEVA